MSRIGRMPVELPAGVSAKLDGSKMIISGPRGTLEQDIHPNMIVKIEGGQIVVERPDDTKFNKALHGLSRALIANMVTGVTVGFAKKLVISGVGYRAEAQGKDLVLQMGFSHPVPVTAPEGITFGVENGGQAIVIQGNDKAAVGEMAARIRAVRKPEPYKGKGIAYEGEVIRRKAGKAGAK